MQSIVNAVERHYSRGNILDTILHMLKSAGKDLDALEPDDLAPVDAFHIRGREATVELAERAGIKSGERVLDVGCGIGGSSRFLAAAHKAQVTGIDLTHEFVDVAAALADLVGLDGTVKFHQGSALELPFADNTFDVAWTEHAQMNIADKQTFYGEMARVLKPGGRIVFHDIFAGPAGQPYYPAPWADESTYSFLVQPARTRKIIEDLGLRFIVWEDTGERSREWMQTTLDRMSQSGPPPLGAHLIVGESAKIKFPNVLRSLNENCLAVYMGVAVKD